ncbi:MAG: hypothetical protein EOS65_02515 [Mesorhizobium sp.]|uniref:hypothetical protein n=1 Tax=Mesorhizobium sp. TaxID=1871066 RepID=UPI000FE81062|nr:hypothetical protein [Mesorhizobium sp.]RWF44269.1 MAG: hypothetical protein EOS65_02515 [Mesorhizobium sp.]
MTARRQWDCLPTAYSLFLCGYDTVEVAKRLNITEDRALIQISQERSKAKGLSFETRPSPYTSSATKKWLAVGNPHLGSLA